MLIFDDSHKSTYFTSQLVKNNHMWNVSGKPLLNVWLSLSEVSFEGLAFKTSPLQSRGKDQPQDWVGICRCRASSLLSWTEVDRWPDLPQMSKFSQRIQHGPQTRRVNSDNHHCRGQGSFTCTVLWRSVTTVTVNHRPPQAFFSTRLHLFSDVFCGMAARILVTY